MKNLIAFIFLFFSDFLSLSSASEGFQAEDYVRIAYQIRSDVEKKLQKELQLDCIGTGGSMMDVVSLICMDFNYYDEVTLDQARRLIIEGSEVLLNAINSSKKIRPYLKGYPFTEKNIEIAIFINKPDGRDVAFDKISCVSQRRSQVLYQLYQPRGAGMSFKDLHKESYAEALRIVNEEKALKNNSEIKSESVTE